MFRQLNAVLVLMAASNSPFSTAALLVAGSAWQTVSKEFGKMKKTFLCALLATALACCGTALYAQQDNMGQGGPPAAHKMPSPEQRLQNMTKTLNLSDEQQQKIKPLLDSESQQMQSLRSDTTMSQQDRRSKMMDIRQKTDDQIKGVLNPDQQQKWQEMQNRHMQGGAGQGRPQLQ